MSPLSVSRSLLDRLLDERPDQRHDAPAAATEVVGRLRRAVHRDLQALLNARRPWRSVPATLSALRTSPVTFGLPDFTAGAFNDRRQREMLRAEIESTLQRFEPRLDEIRVHLTEDHSPLRATLMLRIEAVLLMDPVPEPITFDTTVDVTTASVVLRPLREE
jgi:type VI secretion system protein ImpF